MSKSPLHLARIGTFTDMHGQDVALTPELLAQLAASYDPALYKAPLVIGHPKTNSPAFGWLETLEATPEGLFGAPINVDPAFAEAVNSGRYPQRSLSFWPADHPGSPTPGQPYIRHLGVLGATPPAIPGLRGADLAADDGTTILFSTPPSNAMPDIPEVVDLAAREAALATLQADLDRRAQDLADKELALRRAAVVAFCDGLATEARLRPADVPALAEIVLRLEQSEPAVCFATPGDDTPAAGATWLRGFLASLPPLVELSEVATSERHGASQAPTDTEVANRARAYRSQQAAAGQPLSFAAAVAAVELNQDRTGS
jgi:hypothetical protein